LPRIVFLSPTGQIGGAERSLLDFMVSLREAKPSWNLDLIVGGSGPLIEECRFAGVTVHVREFPRQLARLGDAGAGGPAGVEVSRAALYGRLAFAGVAAGRYALSLHRLLNRLKPDIMHTNGFKMHALGAWARPAGVPLVWHIHDYVSSRAVMTRLLRMFAGRCSAAIANSASVAEDFEAVLKPGMPVYKIWNAVDLKEYSPLGKTLDLDAESGLSAAPRGTVRVGLVGTLAKWKGHETFLKALSLLPSDLPVRGYVIGGPLYETDASQWRMDELKAKAAQLGLGGRVGFTGFVARSAQAMRALDIVVHASTKPEPFGLVLVEAMACGRALIASASGGAKEIFEDGVTALAHTPGDANQLAELIVTLARHRKMRNDLATAGRKAAEQHFDRARLALQLAPIYQGLLSARIAKAA